jgi:RHS repeat-associated protein
VTPTQRAWFGGRLIEKKGTAMNADRLGSYEKAYPYGELATAAGPGEKFATYWRDGGTGLDYAVNRYYSSQMGRFVSADPYQASGGPANPGSWNRYAYVEGDPVNFHDPRGLMAEGPHYVCPYSNSANWLDCYWIEPSMGGGRPFVDRSGPSRGAILSMLRQSLGAAAAAMLVTNLARRTSSEQVPTYLQVVDDCWTEGAPGSISLAYTRVITYQILDSDKKPMRNIAVGGVSISESFREVEGNTEIEEDPGTWVYGARFGIQPNGTFTDVISAGGIPPAFPLRGSAFQSFQASGYLSSGIPILSQFLSIIGFGGDTTVLDVVLGPDNVTINGRGYGKDPSRHCGVSRRAP